FEWDTSGLRCSVSIPRGDMIKTKEFPGTRRTAELHVAATTTAAKSRVLLVEDEALVAMMIQECLTEFGYQVIGPIGTAAEAAARAEDAQFEAAVLDINLGDGAIYPGADVLAARGVPLVFVTGYDADSVDARFRDIPILQKPIEREDMKKIFIATARASAAG
ncbi:MAG: hypothetical protein ACREH9_00820, partial [Pseudomonadota bacterium]